MWKKIGFIFFSVIVCGVTGIEAAKTVAVVDFQLIGGVSHTWGEGFTEVFRTQLAEQKDYKVVERAQLQKVLEEQELSSSTLVDENSAAKFGKILGANYVVTGSVISQETGNIINVRFINVEKGTVELARSIEVAEGEGLNQICKRIVQEISDNLKGTPILKKDKPKQPQIKKSPDTLDFLIGAAGGAVLLIAVMILLFR